MKLKQRLRPNKLHISRAVELHRSCTAYLRNTESLHNIKSNITEMSPSCMRLNCSKVIQMSLNTFEKFWRVILSSFWRFASSALYKITCARISFATEISWAIPLFTSIGPTGGISRCALRLLSTSNTLTSLICGAIRIEIMCNKSAIHVKSYSYL